MTRYDPYAYGEVNLEQEQQAARDPDDMLFAGGDEVKQAPPADSSWSLLEEQSVDDMLPGQPAAGMADAEQFGADVLGESPSAAGQDDIYPPMAEAPMAESLMSQEPDDYESSAPSMGGGHPLMSEPAPSEEEPSPQPAAVEPQPSAAGPDRRPRRKKQPQQPPSEAPLPQPSRELPLGRRNPMSAFAVPLTLCVVGGTASAWVWVTLGNPVLAGIAGAITAVGALFSWLFLRG